MPLQRAGANLSLQNIAHPLRTSDLGRVGVQEVALTLRKVAHRARVMIQPFVPTVALGFGAFAKIALKVNNSRAMELRRLNGERLAASNAPLRLNDFEYRILSQNGEDGILETIFSVIGFKTRSILEFGFAPTEASLVNLALVHDLDAFFMDGSPETCALAASTFQVMKRPRMHVKQAFLTSENINETIEGLGLKGEIDALSIDVDGNDYWLWKALRVIRPRLVIAEYNDRLGPEAPVTVTYDATFDFSTQHDYYWGASLSALTKLAGELGYRLIGCESHGVNAFFLRSDIEAPLLPTYTVSEAFRFQRGTLKQGLPDSERSAIVARLPFTYV